ncbi:hypothetical protein CYMTET_51120 [Cymbomonas tetramitiformis]|uniref:SCP2 domain-containing protein n=1 Tax=Cymbomonas tetramitiformis TaxID=36881 RepID=A0AAE0BN98_9CHLO|nr:hypothetical protein CYMTET_51120 [Cymbomonas tetramitiformis]
MTTTIMIFPTEAAKELKSTTVFKLLGGAMPTKGPELVKKMNAVVAFKIDGQVFTVDLKNGSGSVTEGEAGKADLTITVSDENFLQLVEGKLNSQMAFMSGKLKVGGNMGLAMKLGPILKAAGEGLPKPKL